MTDAQFKEEVARRVAQELKKMETEVRRTTPVPPPDTVARKPADVAVSPTRVADVADPAAAAASSVLRSDPPPTTAPPVRPAAVEAPEASEPPARADSREAVPAPEAVEVQIAPKILRVVKPIYPAVALRARIGGVVLLRVLVSETGTPAEIQVIKGVAGGLTESAVAAVKSWRFTPATQNGVATPAWTTVPIPFEP